MNVNVYRNEAAITADEPSYSGEVLEFFLDSGQPRALIAKDTGELVAHRLEHVRVVKAEEAKTEVLHNLVDESQTRIEELEAALADAHEQIKDLEAEEEIVVPPTSKSK